MTGQVTRQLLGTTVLLAGMLGVATAQAPRPAETITKVAPKFQAVAETKLLMEGLAQANYRGLESLLKQKPGDDATWAFARGQALLIAETGNLLLLRPPRNKGQDAWFRQAMELRSTAAELARAAGARDYAASKAGLVEVAKACNHCHQTFRVSYRAGRDKGPAPRVE